MPRRAGAARSEDPHAALFGELAAGFCLRRSRRGSEDRDLSGARCSEIEVRDEHLVADEDRTRREVHGVVAATAEPLDKGRPRRREHLDLVRLVRGDPELAGVVAGGGAYLCLMHMQGEPRTMQEEPRYDDVAAEVAAFLEERLAFAVAEGIPEKRICLDPGIGFGKTVAQNLELVRRLDVLLALGRPVLAGPSRKSFVGKVLGDLGVDQRLEGTAGAVAWLAGQGVHAVRVHDVKEMVRVVRVVDAIRRGTG